MYFVLVLDDEQNIPGTLFIHERLDVYYFLLVLDDEQNIPKSLHP